MSGGKRSVVSRTTRRKTKTRDTQPSSLKDLAQLRTTAKKAYMHAEATDKSYDGFLDRGRRFLASVIEGRQATPREQSDKLLETEADVKAFSVAFTGALNRYSSMAIELWLVQKCITEGKGESTAEGIHAAFLRHWDHIDGEKYRGPYSCKDGIVAGNPANSAAVQDIMKAIKNKCRADGGTRNHAGAMTIEDMQKMMAWSEKECAPDTLRADFNGVDDLLKAARHFLMRAFASTGFTVWTRNFELCKLQVKHFEFDCVGPGPYYSPYYGLSLENRKGWTSKGDHNGSLSGHFYEIYGQPKTPEIDSFHHLPQWLEFLSTKLVKRRLEPDDYIFPHIAVNGLVHLHKEISHDVAQKYISEFSLGAGLKGIYTTHCFRRGGAQYRFMFAPLGERWTLIMIRWWGGWAEGEHADTLICYLLDELQSYEHNHSDALRPVSREADQSFCGDHVLVGPVTAAETREMKAAIDRKIDEAIKKMEAVMESLGALAADSSSHAAVQRLISAPPPPPPNPSTLLAPRLVPSRNLPLPILPSRTGRLVGPTVRDSSCSRKLPSIPEATIPNLPRKEGWRAAIRQWKEVDPRTGYSLEMWPEEYYTGPMKDFTAAKRSMRKIIANEYEHYGDDGTFLAAFPEANKSISALLKAIDVERLARGELTPRNSKNGTPGERRRNGDDSDDS